jgi:hypothetical protein
MKPIHDKQQHFEQKSRHSEQREESILLSSFFQDGFFTSFRMTKQDEKKLRNPEEIMSALHRFKPTSAGTKGSVIDRLRHATI